MAASTRDPDLTAEDIHNLFQSYGERFYPGLLIDKVTLVHNPDSSVPFAIRECRVIARGVKVCNLEFHLASINCWPRNKAIDMLIHEMIHAVVWLRHGIRNRDTHSKSFEKDRNRVNKKLLKSGIHVEVYHRLLEFKPEEEKE